ncbi:MAG: hypothetical protein GTO48_06275 [Xanthomonadales bacterium]|nr:hypothetical protein [Xanthomonadales bacterium]NIO14006.1 hypothetical protein [Xanthomonadales bacterium]NIP76289.1 hypothetical protein [Xanthomonadales bacterium]NIT08082.1 hypothetical protein [Xanthomonadales bacterium]
MGLPVAGLLWLASALAGSDGWVGGAELLPPSGVRAQPASIFGDGDAANGVEDGRITPRSRHWNDAEYRPWNASAGTIFCDGAVRGSATLLDTTTTAPALRGLVAVTSAHVLVDLTNGKPYTRCAFHWMGLSQVRSSQWSVDLRHLRAGRFDALQNRERAAFGREDWAFLYLPDAPREFGRLQIASYRTLAARVAGVQPVYRMIAYSARLGGMGISAACKVVESGPGDLGGGGWSGQLLDDCDSEQGASGAALIASAEGRHRLVGIRSGTHWDADLFPAQLYPQGPPPGLRWDVRRHTNFSRAIDPELIAALESLLAELQSLPAAGAGA